MSSPDPVNELKHQRRAYGQRALEQYQAAKRLGLLPYLLEEFNQSSLPVHHTDSAYYEIESLPVPPPDCPPPSSVDCSSENLSNCPKRSSDLTSKNYFTVEHLKHGVDILRHRNRLLQARLNRCDQAHHRALIGAAPHGDQKSLSSDALLPVKLRMSQEYIRFLIRELNRYQADFVAF